MRTRQDEVFAARRGRRVLHTRGARCEAQPRRAAECGTVDWCRRASRGLGWWRCSAAREQHVDVGTGASA